MNKSPYETKTELTTTTGMLMSVERFNRLAEIERREDVIPDAKPLIIVSGLREILLTTPKETTLQRIGMAMVHLIGEPGSTYLIHGFRDFQGCWLDLSRPIGEMGFKPFERLFVDFRVEVSL